MGARPKPYYQDDFVTLYHGDARKVLMALYWPSGWNGGDGIEVPLADALITDPPFGVGFKGKWTKHTLPAGGYAGGEDDADVGPQVVDMALNMVHRAVVFPGQRLMFDYPRPAGVGGIYTPSGSGFGPWGFTCFHLCMFYGKRPGSPNYPTVITSFETAGAWDHPCPKPLGWMSWAVSMASLEGETILDPFAGSGTTLRAAKDAGRRAIGIELEESYCEVAAKRLGQEVLDFGGVA